MKLYCINCGTELAAVGWLTPESITLCDLCKEQTKEHQEELDWWATVDETYNRVKGGN